MCQRMNADDRVAPLFRAAREEASDERAVRIVDPFVLVADHVVDGVFPPPTRACFRRARGPKKRAILGRHEPEAWIGMSSRGVVVQLLRWVPHPEHVADAGAIVASVRVFRLMLAATRELP